MVRLLVSWRSPLEPESLTVIIPAVNIKTHDIIAHAGSLAQMERIGSVQLKLVVQWVSGRVPLCIGADTAFGAVVQLNQ